MRGRPAAVLAPAALLLLVALAAAACGGPSVPTPAPSPPAPAATPSLVTASPTPAASPAASPPSSAAASPAGGVVLDESLLAILPPAVDGIAVAPEPDSFAQAAADPDFTRNVGSAAFAVVADGSDLASGVVAALKPGRYSDALFRDWRDSYNEGACAQAGGVAGNAEAEMGGRTVYIASCVGGLRVYHAWLPERGAIVSLFSLGDRRFGERIMGDLRP
jgi:hypothetical protein